MKDNKKVGIVVTQFEAGGAQKAAINLANGLSQMGNEVILFFLYKKSEWQYQVADGVEIVFLVEDSCFFSKLFLVPLRFNKLLRLHRLSCIISFTHYANIYSALFGKINKIPVIASHRNPLFSYPLIAKLFDKLFYNLGLYSHLTYVSTSTKESFVNNGYTEDTPSTVIYNSVDVELFDRSLIDEYVTKNYLVVVGRLSVQKNHLFLLDAFSLSSYKGVLIIIGDGELREDVENKIVQLGLGERVVLIPNVPNKLIPSIMHYSDAYLMPSLFEGMSNALLEAIAVGARIITSDIPSQREAVLTDQGYCCATLLPINEKSEWAGTLNELDNNKINNEACIKLKTRYSHANFISSFNRVIEDVINAP